MILLHEPYLNVTIWQQVQACLESGWVSSAGPWVTRFESQIADYTKSAYTIATQSGTAALHLAFRLAGLQAGDYVLMPALGFVALPNAATYLGATPIFIDVSSETWQMDDNLLEQFLATETYLDGDTCRLKTDHRPIRAVSPVHTLGYTLDLSRLYTLAERFSLAVVEDAAEAFGSHFQSQHAGSNARLAVLSFNGNKTLTTGGGGMILTSDQHLAKRALHLSTQAKCDALYYDHDDVGYNYRMSSLAAALGLGQLAQFDNILGLKRAIHQQYQTSFRNWDKSPQFLATPQGVEPNYWLNTPLFQHKAQRDAVMQHLMTHQVQVRPLWKPLPQLSPYTHSLYIRQEKEAVAVDLANRSLSLPSSPGLSQADQSRVIQLMRESLEAP